MEFLKEIFKFVFIVLSILYFVGAVDILINAKGKENKAGEPFIPTKEWQVVKKGQQIPPGLHIRSNLQTGVTEAKLMDRKGSKDHAAIVVKEGKTTKVGMKKVSKETQKPEQEQERSKLKSKNGPAERLAATLSREQILAALKDIGKKDDVKNPKVAEKAKDTKFRSYDELKKDFEKINMKIRTDFEIIKELMQKLNSTNATSESKIAALTDLEYYLHQIDNARDFADHKGLELLLLEMKNSNWRVRSEANYAMASALQSNTKVQIRAFELGLLQALLKQLQAERETTCLNRVLFALSALLRNFPFAQLRFVQQGGLQTVGELFRDPGRSSERLNLRTITMLTDFLTEKSSHEAAINRSDPMHIEKERQYRQVAMEQHLLREGWCGLVPPMLARAATHDGREKILKFLLATATFCPQVKAGQVSSVELQGHLMKLNTEYVTLAAQEVAEGESNGYFSSLQALVRTVLENTAAKRSNDEL